MIHTYMHTENHAISLYPNQHQAIFSKTTKLTAMTTSKVYYVCVHICVFVFNYVHTLNPNKHQVLRQIYGQYRSWIGARIQKRNTHMK